MNKLGKVAVALAMALGGASADAKDYYIAPDGSDANSGESESAALKSLSVALEKANDDDTIHIAEGDYPDMTPTLHTFTNPDKGRSQQYFLGVVTKAVTIVGAGEAVTVLHGNEPADMIETWRPGGIWVENVDATVSGLAFTDCFSRSKNNAGDDDTSKRIGAAIHLVSGTVTGCRVFNLLSAGTQNGRNPPVYLSGGTFSDSIVTNNQQGQYGKSPGGVFVDGGTMEGCFIADNTGPDNDCAHGVKLGAGTVRDCVIYGNHSRNVSWGNDNRAGGVSVLGGTLERCVIAGNSSTPSKTSAYAGGLCVYGAAKVRNCLIWGNSTSSTRTDAAGGLVVDHDQADVCNVTVVGNASGSGCEGVRLLKGKVKGMISWGHPVDFAQTGGTVTYSCFKGADDADGNIAADPLLKDATFVLHRTVAEYAEFMPDRISPCRDKMPLDPVVPDDLRGLARDATPDMGCHEIQPLPSGDFALAVRPPEGAVIGGEGFSVTAVVEGDATGIAEYVWTVIVNGVEEQQVTTQAPTLTIEESTFGRYDFVVSASNGRVTREGGCSVDAHTRVCYVSLTGGNTAPYATPETAAHSLCDALETVWGEKGKPGTVYVEKGDYTSMATTLSGAVTVLGALNKPVHVIGQENPEDVIFRYAANDTGGGVAVSDPEASICGVTFIGTSKASTDSDYLRGMAIHLTDGLVSNCVITACDCKGSRSQPFFSIYGGVMTHCAVTNNKHTINNAYARGGMIGYLSGGTLRRTHILRNNMTYADQAQTSGLMVEGGTVEDCEIVGVNSTSASSGVSHSATALYQTGGTVRRCLFAAITNQTGNVKCAAAVELNGAAVLENCLIVDAVNSSTVDTSAGALIVRHKDAVVRHVTVTRSSVAANVGALNLSAGTVIGSIVSGNAKSPDVTQSGGTLSWSCYPEADGTDGNIAENPSFENTTGQLTSLDGLTAFMISTASPCRNAARYGETLVTDDIVGNPRAEYGSSGKDYPDMGCYELQASTEVTAVITMAEGGNFAAGDTMTFTVTLDLGGEPVAVKSSTWTVSDGTHVHSGTVEGGVFTVPAATSGDYTVSVTAESEDGETASRTSDAPAKVRPLVCFVSTEGTAEYPYDEPAKATSNICDAVAAVYASESRQGRVLVADGTYRPTKTVMSTVFEAVAVLDRNIAIVGNDADPSQVFVDFTPEIRASAFVLSHAKARLSGITVKALSRLPTAGEEEYTSIGQAINLTAGTVSNCVVTGCDRLKGTAILTQVPVSIAGGTFTDGKIVDNVSTCQPETPPYARHGAVYVNGGTLQRTLVAGNGAAYGDLRYAGGVALLSGLVRDCEICHNFLDVARASIGVAGDPPCGTAAGLHMSGGTIERCHIHDNTNLTSLVEARPGWDATTLVHASGGAFIVRYGKMRNCLIDRNFSANSSEEAAAGLGLYCMWDKRDAKALNVTVADNVAPNGAQTALYLGPFSTVENVLAVGTCKTNTQESVVRTSLMGEIDAKFRDAAGGNYRLSYGSPAIDAGTNGDWTPADVDLNGEPRIFHKTVDIGCSEYQFRPGLMLLVK